MKAPPLPFEALALFLHLVNAEIYRRQYAAEREHPEWVDLGGES